MFESDSATEELARTIDEASGEQRLWVADEHTLSDRLLALLAARNLYLISNRYDQVRRAREAGIRASFSDFDLQHPDKIPWDSIFFRIAKEKAVVHQVINSAANLLRDKGTLWLAGYRNEGAKTYLSKAESLFGRKAIINRGRNQLLVGQIGLYVKGTPLADDNYHDLRQIQMSKSENYWSKPGVYGWKSIDKGSQYLINTLESMDIDLCNSRVLDLGCGYGYLSRNAIERGATDLVATDNCAAAMLACRKNIEGFADGNYVCVPSDCADEIAGKFGLILCNPPFHSGFSTSSELHQRFLRAIRDKLDHQGQALIVVNQFLRLQNICKENGLEIVERLRDNQLNFDLYRLQHQR